MGQAPSTDARPAHVASIPVEAIDWSYTIRPINPNHLLLLSSVAHLPPITVWAFQHRQYRGIDGYHRWRLARERGQREIAAVVCHFAAGHEGIKAFELECIRRNIEHGLPLTREQRDEAIAGLWHRWGHAKTRPDGITLEGLGKLFNLTKPRIHQILSARPVTAASQIQPDAGPEDEGSYEAKPRLVVRNKPGGFSAYGRFTAATHRLATILNDTGFMADLLEERDAEVLAALRELEGLITAITRSSEAGA